KIIIPNAIDVGRYAGLEMSSLRNLLGIEQGTLLIGQVGSLSPFKNQLFTLQLAKALKVKGINFKLLFVGKGGEEYTEQIHKQVIQDGLEEYVELMGLRQDIPEIMNALDILVLPSLFEGLGIVAIEAQAAGTPCLVSTGVPEEVDMGLGLVTYLSLEYPEEWICQLSKCQVKEGQNLQVIHQAITSKKYNIRDTAHSVEAAYCAS
ncbi:MAG: glycosyltransferase, partial [Niameybacter sp.]